MTTRPLEIPDDLDRCHPNEITDWLSTVANDEATTDEDLVRAHDAARHALAVLS